jgi:hypothetical protein
MLAMLAVFAVKHWKCKVHILENNRTLLDRDYADYEEFYRKCGVSSSKDLESDAKIVYCLKKDNNLFLMKQLVGGELDLSKHVMLVDEVDDLIVRRPTKTTRSVTARRLLCTPSASRT